MILFLGSLFQSASGYFQTDVEKKNETANVYESLEVIYTAEDFRHRSGDIPPKLVYTSKFFERFEPLSAGDILKRIPGISGSADAGEFDLAQLRGIGPQNTQITINGRRVPGAGNDHTVFIDRIPANMVDRLEIIRSPSSDMDAQGTGGTINIVLKDAVTVSQLNVLAGFNHSAPDQTQRGQAYLGYGHRGKRFEYSLHAAMIQRYNPKQQTALLLDNDGPPAQKYETNILDSIESSFSIESTFLITSKHRLTAKLLLLSTDRSEDEHASFFAGDAFEEGQFDDASLRQDLWSGELQFLQANSGGGQFGLTLDFSQLDLDRLADLGSFGDGNRELEGIDANGTRDHEIKLQAFNERWIGGNHRIKYGVDLEHKRRDANQTLTEFDGENMDFQDNSGDFSIERSRIDPFFLHDWQLNSRHQIQSGLRVEITDLELTSANIQKTDAAWFPSFHYRFQKTSADIFRLSLARTTRRQDFRELQPFSQRNQPRDGDTLIGNPNLDPEFSSGIDAGFEHRFRHQEGLLGLNFFYRNIENLMVTTQIGGDLFQPINQGNGEVYGLELDLGFPLDSLKLPNISIYTNLTLQRSRMKDPLTGGDPQFNAQPDNVINFGLLHYLPSLRASYGLNWLAQGGASERFLTESVAITYGQDLEFILEKKWGDQTSIRLGAKNLLDSSRDEVLIEYEGLRDQSDVDLMGIESETSGRRFFITFRCKF